MYDDPSSEIDLGRQRTLGQIVTAAGRLYWRHALMLFCLAGIVVIPFQIVVVALEHGHGSLKVGTEAVLLLAELALIDPCVAAVQVQVVLDLGTGRRPDLIDVLRRGFWVLPVVAAAEIVAGIGIAIGAIFFIIPGILLAVRWGVVAQAAAVEQTNWPGALRRGGQLARFNYWRIFGILVLVGVINQIPAEITGTGKHVVAVVLGVIVAILVHSFGTLLNNLLYFDLRARESTRVA